MIEIRSFEGSNLELADFVVEVWSGDYAGKMAFPLWSADYFDWQIGPAHGAEREQVLAAYDDGRLAGVIVGATCDFRVHGRVVPGLISSWLSISREQRGRGLVGRLKQEQERRARDQGRGLILAYRYFGSLHSLAKQPTAAELDSGEWSVRQVGFWVRVLRPLAAARWYVSRGQRWLTRLTAPFVMAPRAAAGAGPVRRYEARDADDCLMLVHSSTARRDFGIEWTTDALRRHCGGPFARCLVAEEQGAVRGFISFHVLRFRGLTDALVGVIDIIEIQSLSRRAASALVNQALHEIREEGGIAALKLRTGDVPPGPLLRAGFIPWFSDSHQAVRWLEPFPARRLGNSHSVLWR